MSKEQFDALVAEVCDGCPGKQAMVFDNLITDCYFHCEEFQKAAAEAGR